MSLIKGPFLVKADEHVLNHVSDIVYIDDKLTLDILVTDFDTANRLLKKTPISAVYCIGCGSREVGATYRVKKYSTSVIIKDYAVMTLRVVFDVWHVKVGEINESN